MVGFPVLQTNLFLWSSPFWFHFSLSSSSELKRVVSICHVKNSGAYLERKTAGVHSVRIQNKYLNGYEWGYQVIYPFPSLSFSSKNSCLNCADRVEVLKLFSMKVGLSGENLRIFTEYRSGKVQWSRFHDAHHRPIWYKVRKLSLLPVNMSPIGSKSTLQRYLFCHHLTF